MTAKLSAIPQPREHAVLYVGRRAEGARRRTIRRPLVVGSAGDADVQLVDPAVSRAHLRISPSPRGVLVEDLGSRNGTYVGGVRVTRAEISGPTVLRVGRSDLLVDFPREGEEDVVAASPAMREISSLVERYAALPFTVLIRGETGVGKEGIAEALHARGPRASGPFVAVNAGGFVPELVESQLFGHEKGAFTGATARHRGAFERAHGGTLFLDEIGELPLSLQARLLRVLERREILPLGGESPIRVDVRIVCATHRDLDEEVARGRFRRDLLFRLRELCIEVPPLRERPADVRALAEHFLRRIEPYVGRKELAEEALARLLSHSFPGNARELRNVLTHAASLCPADVIREVDVERALEAVGAASVEPSGAMLREVLEVYGGNQSRAAEALGLPRSTFRDRLKRDGARRAGRA
ncbi:MAG: sigma 54-interacting transcriptional regulator [Myxococcales bacterium]|nr:sigma 54-interacting transcriptional regulator [Myxococcales bacterium]